MHTFFVCIFEMGSATCPHHRPLPLHMSSPHSYFSHQIANAPALAYLIRNNQKSNLKQSVRNHFNIILNMEHTNTQTNPKCKHCNLFFANSAFSGYCSKCYKDNGKEKETQDNKTSVSVEDRELQEEFAGLSLKEEKEEKVEQTDRKRCFCCKKKTGLLGVECKCGYVFCNGHRMPEDHKCSFNHKAVLDERLKRQLNKVAHEKVIDF